MSIFGRGMPDEQRELVRLMAQHKTQLMRMAYMYLGDMGLAEEAVQDTFLKAYAHLDRFRGESGEATWLTRIAINTCKDIRRTAWFKSRRNTVAFDAAAGCGEHSIFHDGQGASTGSTELWRTDALTPFVFAEGDTPVYSGSMRVMIVNPNAPDREAAQAFIAAMTGTEYGVMRDYVLHADAVEPYAKKPYSVTAEMIAQWQSAAAAVAMPTDDPLTSDAFRQQAQTLIARYAAGQMDDGLFLGELNRTAGMVGREA